jgi:hypothetical protein
MLDEKFYWGTVRKSIVAFGNMFNNIVIDRRNSANNLVESIKVPLAYAPKQKLLARIEQQPDTDTKNFMVVLPRMSFEMVGIEYDPSRKISPIQQNRAVNSTSSSLNQQYAPTPYNINMRLYIYSKNQDDGLQVLEQILPYFNPDYNLTLKAIPALDIKNDLPILLETIDYEDNYEGDFALRRSIIWSLNFVMKLNFYGPINRQGIIRKVIATTFNKPDLTAQNQKYTVSVDPDSAIPGDSIDFLENFEEF